MMMLMREGAREAAMMIGVDGRRRRHSSAALSTYPRRARDVGGARTRGRGRHRPPGGHRVALRLEKERERGPQGEKQLSQAPLTLKIESDSPTSRRLLDSRDRSSDVLAGLILQVRGLVDLARRSAIERGPRSVRERRLWRWTSTKNGVKTRSGHRDKNATTWANMSAWAEHGA